MSYIQRGAVISAILVTVLYGAVSPSKVAAQEAGAAVLEEITVTARKREESLLDIPVAISVFTAADLQANGMFNLEDISYNVPGVQFHSQGGAIPGRVQTAIRFRGMDPGSGTITSPSQQIGTAFIDGVYIASGVQSLSFLGVERVEIIKGPQSALFGRSTFGGAINYVTAPPSTSDYSGQVSAMIAEDGLFDVSVSHEGPLIRDKLAYRIGLRGYGDGGQFNSALDGGSLGDEESETIVASLFATPIEGLSSRFNVMYQRDEDGPATGFFMGNANSNFGNGPRVTNCFDVRPDLQGGVNPLSGAPLTEFFCGELPGVDVDAFTATQTALSPGILDSITGDTFNDRPLPDVPDQDGMGFTRTNLVLSFLADYTFAQGILDGATVSNVTGYNEVRSNWIRDFDLTPAGAGVSRDPVRFETFSTELRLASSDDQRLRWLLGVNYFDAEFVRQGNGGIVFFNAEANPDYTVGGAPIPFPLPLLQAAFSEEGGETIGVFGSLGFDVSEQLTLDFEWRWQDDEVSNSNPETGVSLDQSFDNFLPRVTVSYQPSDESTLWFTYAKGNVPGFFNPDFATLTQEQQDAVVAETGSAPLFLDEEELDSFELGWKQSFWEDRVNFSLVGYYMEWTDRKTQVPVIVPDPVLGQRSLNIRINSGDTDLWGAEFEGQAILTPKLRLVGTFNWAASELKNFFCVFSAQFSGTTDCSGNESPRFPEFTGSFAFDWNDRLVDDWDYFARFDGNFFGEAPTDESNLAVSESYWRFNLRSGVQRENFRLELFVTNLFDHDKFEAASRFSDFSGLELFSFTSNQGVIVTPADERRLGFRVSYDF